MWTLNRIHQEFSPAWFKQFIQAWAELPWNTRQYLSHQGAVRRRVASDPLSFRSPHGVEYFDPGNRVYLKACLLLFDERLCDHYNANTIGNFMEALLGYAYPFRIGAGSRHAASNGMAKMIDDVVYFVYALEGVTCGADASFAQWMVRVEQLSRFRHSKDPPE